MVTEYPSVLPARIVRPSSRQRTDRLVIVADPDGEVEVRWRLGRADPWRCGAHGPQPRVACAHAFAAALLLADDLLGLTRVPELNPERKTA